MGSGKALVDAVEEMAKIYGRIDGEEYDLYTMPSEQNGSYEWYKIYRKLQPEGTFDVYWGTALPKGTFPFPYSLGEWLDLTPAQADEIRKGAQVHQGAGPNPPP